MRKLTLEFEITCLEYTKSYLSDDA